jgi:hypothetical protein
MYGVKICKNILCACVVRIKDGEDIVDITGIVYNHIFFDRCAMCTGKIPDKIPDDGAP